MTKWWIRLPKLPVYIFANMNLLWFHLARIWLRLLCTVVQATHCTMGMNAGWGAAGSTLIKPHALVWGWIFPGTQLLILVHTKALYRSAESWILSFYTAPQPTMLSRKGGSSIDLAQMVLMWAHLESLEEHISLIFRSQLYIPAHYRVHS